MDRHNKIMTGPPLEEIKAVIRDGRTLFLPHKISVRKACKSIITSYPMHHASNQYEIFNFIFNVFIFFAVTQHELRLLILMIKKVLISQVMFNINSVFENSLLDCGLSLNDIQDYYKLVKNSSLSEIEVFSTFISYGKFSVQSKLPGDVTIEKPSDQLVGIVVARSNDKNITARRLMSLVEICQWKIENENKVKHMSFSCLEKQFGDYIDWLAVSKNMVNTKLNQRAVRKQIIS